MEWLRYGRIFDPGQYPCHPKLLTHSSNPVPIHLFGSYYRVYYSGRDAENRSSVGAFEFCIDSRKITKTFYYPFITNGGINNFDSDGVSLGCHFEKEGKHFLLYMGWQTKNLAHWRGDIGCLDIAADGTLTKSSAFPFKQSDENDPISLSYPAIAKVSDGYLMVYGSTVAWETPNSEMLHVLKMAHSQDCLTWQPVGSPLPYELGLAQAFSRPTVLCDLKGNINCWFSFRSGNGGLYKIGFAKIRRDYSWEWDVGEVHFDTSTDDWESDMVEYPYVLDHCGDIYMLYNGNGFGKTGIGLAKIKSKECLS